jgi:outer membrane protein assembly factor BamE
MRPIGIFLLLVLAGCSLTAHKIDMQQGNYVDQAMIDKLKPGMTRSQVRFVLGTPLIADAFHPNRWDYVFLKGKAGKVRPQHRITVVFDGDKLMRVEGDIAVPESLSHAAAGAANLDRHETRAEA